MTLATFSPQSKLMVTSEHEAPVRATGSDVNLSRFWRRVSALLLFTGLVHLASATQASEIVQDSKPLAEIVVGDDSMRVPKFAAQELQNYIEKISGAKLPIVSEPSVEVPVKIYVGKSRFTDELGLKTEGLQNGAYRMAAGDNWLALLGPDKNFVPTEPWGKSRSKEETARINAEFDKITGDTFYNNFREVHSRHHEELGIWDLDDTGTLNAVYDYLRSLGVRWYAPGEIGEVVPEKLTITLPVPMNETVEPDFSVRRISFFHEFLVMPVLALWKLRLGVNNAQDILGLTQIGHGMKFVLMRDEMKKKHPEIYALWDGERATDHKGGQGAPRLGSPLLKEKHLKYARAVFDHFDEPMISLDVVDGFSGRISEDDKDLATPERGWRGSMSDYLWGYVNSVAEELYKSHPDRFVSGLSYGAYSLPPEDIETMSPNLVLIACRHRSRLSNPNILESDRELRKAWLAKLPSGKFMTWDYYLHAWPARDPGPPAYFPRLIAKDLKELKGVSMGDAVEVYDHRPGTADELGYDEFAVNHLNIYTTSRYWWDADQNIDALLDDYYTNYYGPASSQMKAFIEFSEANWSEMKRDGVKISEGFKLLADAQEAAPKGSIYAKRIDLVAQYMKPLEAIQEELKVGRKNIPEAPISARDVKLLTLDGNLDDDFWSGVATQSFREIKEGGVPAEGTEFRIAVGSDKMLYLAIRCRDSDMENLNIMSTVDGDAAIWSGDFIEVQIETPDHLYYQICVGPAGNIMDIDRSEGLNDEWKSGVEVAVNRGKDEWTVEMRIPPAGATASEIDPNTGISGDLPTVNDPWYINVGRVRLRDGDAETSAWSPTGGTFHKPVPGAQKAFGRIFIEK